MFFLFLSSVLFGLEYPLASALLGDMDAMALAFHFLLILTVIQFPFVLMKHKEVMALRRERGFSILAVAGLIGTFLYWCEFSSLSVGIPVSHLTFISLSVPAWALLYEYLRGRGTGHNLNKWALALMGSMILIAPGKRGEFSASYLLPIFTSLLSALWLIYSKRSQEKGISPIVCSFFNDFFALVGITILILLKERSDSFNVIEGYGSVAIYAVVVGLLPNLLLFYGLQKVNVVSAATLIMLEPLISGVLVVIISNEALSINLIAGSVLVFSSTLPDSVLNIVRRVSYGISHNLAALAVYF